MIHPLLKLRRSTDRTPDQVSAHSGHRGDQWTPPAASLIISRVSTPQGGIFALGTASHAYLEFNASAADGGPALVAAIAALREPRTTMGGVNLVAGFRPELWRAVAPEDAPPGVVGFNEDLVGIHGFVMPATQCDAVLWLSGSAYDVVFDMAREAIGELGGLASLGDETSSWPYRHDRDIWGIDQAGVIVPVDKAGEVAVVPVGPARRLVAERGETTELPDRLAGHVEHDVVGASGEPQHGVVL